MSFLGMLLWGTILALPPELAKAARSYERRVEVLASCKLEYRVYKLTEGADGIDQTAMNESHFLGSELRGRIRTFHFSDKVRDRYAAERADPLLNTIIGDGERVIHYKELARNVFISKRKRDPVQPLALAPYTRLLFLLPPTEKEYLDSSYGLVVRDNQMVMLLARDLWLPPAFRQPGWQVERVDAGTIVHPPLGWRAGCTKIVHAYRKMAGGISDDLWIDPDRDDIVVARRLMLADGTEYLLHYGDIQQYPGLGWLPRYAQRRIGDQNVIEEVERWEPYTLTSADLEIQYLPGTVIRDQISGENKTIPGGEDLLSSTISLLRHGKPNLRRSASFHWHVYSYAGLVLGIVVGIVCSKFGKRRARPVLTPTSKESSV